MKCAGEITLLFLCLLPLPIRAADEWSNEQKLLTNSCSSLFTDLKQIGSCAEFLFSSGYPVHASIPQSVVPGGGTPLGVIYTQHVNITNWTDSTFVLQGGSSVRGFWFGDAVLTFDHKKWIRPLSPGDRFQAKAYAHARGLPLLPFYGIGPNTTRSGLVDFRQRDISVGTSVLNPMSSWLDIGGGVEYFRPRINGVPGASVRSIEQFYSEATAPGVASQPNFVHYRVFALPKHSWSRTNLSSEIAFDGYQDMDSGHYTSRIFRTGVLQRFYPEIQTEPTAGGTGKRRQPRYDSVLSIAGRFSAASASNGNVVPLYLQDTIGGSDIHNVASLRGFQDYRFRAPDSFSLQAQYERRLLPAPPRGSPRASTLRSIAGALGVMAFFDAGEVANQASNFDFGHVRHTFGFGINFWSGGKVWFRAYVGLGSGEGHHTFAGVVSPGAESLHL